VKEPVRLTPTEELVMWLVVQGFSNRIIGRKLGMSEHTVKFHVNNLLEKYDARTRTHAAVQFVLSYPNAREKLCPA
jgi:two-component system nitrate/nitrite response regulator NarL